MNRSVSNINPSMSQYDPASIQAPFAVKLTETLDGSNCQGADFPGTGHRSKTCASSGQKPLRAAIY
jgi:hypothetical protein